MAGGEKSKKRRRRKQDAADTGTDKGKGKDKVLEEEEEEDMSNSNPCLEYEYDINGYEYDGKNKKYPARLLPLCWDKAAKVKGRDPSRWRTDSLGNTLFRRFIDCPGFLCYSFEPIIPYSKGGQPTLDNCQVIQRRVIRETGNQTDVSSSHCRVEERDMDLLEQLAYGNVRRDSPGGCRIQ